MHAQPLAVIFCALSSLATLSVAHIQKRSFTIDRVPNPDFAGRNGPRAMVRSYRKYMMPLPAGLESATTDQAGEALVGRSADSASFSSEPFARDVNQTSGGGSGNSSSVGIVNGNGTNIVAGGGGSGNGSSNGNQTAAGQTGSVAAMPGNSDTEFVSPIQIGGQTVHVDIDTGSSDFWVFSAQLDDSVTANHRVYDASKSSTFKLIPDTTFKIFYGDGTGAKGDVGTDVVDVGGASVPNQAVQMANAVSQGLAKDQSSDGLMGLGFSLLNSVRPQKQKTFFENVKGSLAEPVFTADLRKGAEGRYTFGAIDRSRFQGELTWVPVNTTRGLWQFSSEQFAVNGSEPQGSTSGGQAIADTGTTLILADPVVVDAYYDQVSGASNDAIAGGYTFPCDAALPDLALDVGGTYMANISGSDINYAPVSGGKCYGGLQASPAGSTGIYGDIFFRSQFVVFNAGNNTLGLAPHAAGGDNK